MKRSYHQLTLDTIYSSESAPIAKKFRVNRFNVKTWISASSLKNYMIDDPLLDWLKYHHCWNETETIGSTGDVDLVHCDSDNDQKSITDADDTDDNDDIDDTDDKRGETGVVQESFTEFICNKGLEFEKRIYQDLKRRYGNNVVRVSKGYSDIISEKKAKETEELILAGKPIIYNGVLHNKKNETYGAADLIVRSDWLNKLVSGTIKKEEMREKGSKLKGKYHYRIIDIKYQVLHLKADGEYLLNSGYIPAYKAQVMIYTWALEEIQGYLPKEGYLMGRGYMYTSKGEIYSGDGCYDKMGKIDLKGDGKDEQYVKKTKKAIEWVREVRSIGRSWKIYPPSRNELYPNMCNNRNGPYSQIKKEIAEKLQDITLIWQCGPKHRKNAFDANIYSWSDQRCTAEILGHKGEKIGPIVQKMLEFNQGKIEQNKEVIPDIISDNSNDWQTTRKLEIFLDLETIPNIFDDLSQLPNMGGKTLIFLIGVGYCINNKWKFKYFRLENLTLEAEETMLNEFIDWLKTLFIQYHIRSFKDYIIYHWSHADPAFLASAYGRHPNIKPLMLHYFDLFNLFKSEPILIKGVFNFSLKTIIEGLREKKLIQFSRNKECTNGCQAMLAAWHCYNHDDSIDNNVEFQKIINYNKEDCESLYEIILYLRKNHCASKNLNEIKCSKQIDLLYKKSVQNSNSMTSRYNLRSRKRIHDDSDISDEHINKKKLIANAKTTIKYNDCIEEMSDDYNEDNKKKEMSDEDKSEEDSEDESEEDENGIIILEKAIDKMVKEENLTNDEEEKLNELISTLKKKEITLKHILQAELPPKDKTEILEQYLMLQAFDPLSGEYKELQAMISAKLFEAGVVVDEELSKEEQEKLSGLKKIMKDITIKSIINAEIPEQRKISLLEKYQILKTLSPLSSEYTDMKKCIIKELETLAREGVKTLEERIEESNLPMQIKERLRHEYTIFEKLTKEDSEYMKKLTWFEYVLKLPTKTINLPLTLDASAEERIKFEATIKSKLDTHCYGMKEVKEAILDFIFNRLVNPTSTKHILALAGPKGVGKTSLCLGLSEALNLPLVKISLGGAADAGIVKGDRSVWIGSGMSRITKGMIESKCTNPIVYLDEVDKISGKKNSDLSDALIEILDPTQNVNFTDEYLSVPINLSQIFWVLTFNNEHKIDEILRDRMDIIRLKGYTLTEKVDIAKNYLIPTILNDLNLTRELILPDELLPSIIELTEKEEGVRRLQSNLSLIFKRLNRIRLTSGLLGQIKVTTPTLITQSMISHIVKPCDQSTYHALYI